MNKKYHWNSNVEKTLVENEVNIAIEPSTTESISIKKVNPQITADFDEPDRTDYVVAASCGILAGLFDVFFVGEYSLENAQNWGRTNANNFVIKVAQVRGYKKNELEGAIRFLEKDAPMASDKLTSIWGGGLQHHFRDFAHHASIVGLTFSVLSQFTGMSYGTNTEGLFEVHKLPDDAFIGKTFEEKIFNGVVLWALHLVSDMAGSANSAGKGTGIPGPLLSLVKELSVLPGIRNIQLEVKENNISISQLLSKIFNGTVFEYTSHKDLKRFDLRTELGSYAFIAKQSAPIVINQCFVRAFYLVRRLCVEISDKQIKSISDLKAINPDHFLPWKNNCIQRMLTISSGLFCAVDISDAAIRASLVGNESKGEFVVKLLSRTNFIGIGSFMVSIVNDISGHLHDNDEILQEEETICNDVLNHLDNIVIDVSVEIDSAGIYRYAFYCMKETVRENKEKLSLAINAGKDMQESILKLEDEETYIFDKVAKISSHSLIIETEKLIMRLFAFYGIGYIPLSDDLKYGQYTPFYRIENNKKVAYTFIPSYTSKINWDAILNNSAADEIKAVALVELGKDANVLEEIIRYERRKCECVVENITLKELFSLISDDEYLTYKKYVQDYNEDIQKMIGYKTLVIPSESSLQKMKDNVENEMRNTDFAKALSEENIREGQIKKIETNFWDKGTYKAMFGDTSFAESFISAEWYFQTHIASSALEQTAIIAGYLKSVEQLLYSLVKLSLGTGKTIRKKGGTENKYISFSEDNLDIIDVTLGSMTGYVRHYSDLWDVNGFVKHYVADKLDFYREKYRNDHFHKDNIHSHDEIKEIRYYTMFVHFLLLGAMKIEKSQMKSLGIYSTTVAADKETGLKYQSLAQWLDRILGGDVLLPVDSIIYFEIGVRRRECWGMKFTTVSGFDEKGSYFYPQDMEWPYISDVLEWGYHNEDKETAEKQAVQMLQQYLEKGKYSGNLKVYKSVNAGWFGNRIELYKRK